MVAKRAPKNSGLYMTVEQYLALDESSDAKYEYADGYAYLLRPPSSGYDNHQPLDLAGGSPAHAALENRLGALLDNALVDSPCIVYGSDARLKLDERHYRYADVVVACSEQNEPMLTNPVVVIEVLSPSTEKDDRGEKFEEYKRLQSVKEYVLVGSQSKLIVVYRRENSWRPYHYQEGNMVELTSIGVSFPYDRVYRGIRLG